MINKPTPDSIRQPLIYVAGPYHGAPPEVTLRNIMRAEEVSIALIRNGWAVFTPHKNTSGYERYVDGHITSDTWIQMDLNILSRCDTLYVMNNWWTSTGTQIEILFATLGGIPIIYESECAPEEFTADYVCRRGW